MSPARLGDLIDGTLTRMGLQARYREQRAVLVWPEVVGEMNARRSRAERVKDGVLLVSAASPAWAQELTLLKSQMLQRLRERLGDDVIKDIRFSSSNRRRRPTPAPRAVRRGTALAEVPVDERSVTQIDRVLSTVADPELRQTLRRSLLTLARLRAWRAEHGWRRCGSCGGLHRRRSKACPVCDNENKRRRWRRLRLAAGSRR